MLSGYAIHFPIFYSCDEKSAVKPQVRSVAIQKGAAGVSMISTAIQTLKKTYSVRCQASSSLTCNVRSTKELTALPSLTEVSGFW